MTVLLLFAFAHFINCNCVTPTPGIPCCPSIPGITSTNFYLDSTYYNYCNATTCLPISKCYIGPCGYHINGATTVKVVHYCGNIPHSGVVGWNTSFECSSGPMCDNQIPPQCISQVGWTYTTASKSILWYGYNACRYLAGEDWKSDDCLNDMPFTPMTTSCEPMTKKKEETKTEEEIAKRENIETNNNEQYGSALFVTVRTSCNATAASWPSPYGNPYAQCGSLNLNFTQFMFCCNGGLFGSPQALVDPRFGADTCKQGSFLHPLTSCAQTMTLNYLGRPTFCPNGMLAWGGSLPKYNLPPNQYADVKCP